MKFKLMHLSFLLATILMSCNSDDDNTSTNNSTNTTPDQVQSTVVNGSWRITSFIDSGDDETNYFNGYNFTFNDATLVASNGTNTYQGTWSITDSNSNDDNPDDLHFNIYFNLTNDFEELNEDWNFISNSATKIELIHISGGNGGTDYLTFQKN